MKIFLQGDFETNTGPAVANRSLRDSLKRCSTLKTSFRKSNFFRLIEIISKIYWCDIVILCSFSKINFVSLKLAKLFKKPIFYYMHGCHKIESKINNVYNNNLIQQEEYLLKHVKKIICVSDFLRQNVGKVYQEYKGKMLVHYNCMDLSQFSFDSNRNNKNKKILSTGGGMPRKANLPICKAIQELNKEKNTHIEYTIIGDYYGRKKEFDRFKFVTYYENLPHDKVLQEMKEANLYIQNSQFETFGLAVMEAVLQGTSLLMSKNIGAKEVFSNLNQNDIIYETNNIEEIKSKIWKCLEDNNAERLYEGIKFNEIDTKVTGKSLLLKLFL